MAKLIMMMGLPGSGKSTKAQQMQKSMGDGTIVLSSDELRKELFGDEEIQTDHAKVFDELHRRAKKALLEGKNVIYDATNLNSRRRMGYLRQLPKGIKKELYFVNEDITTVKIQDFKRERRVGDEVINQKFKILQIPYLHEKWDKITVDLGSYANEVFDAELQRSILKSMSERLYTYEEFAKVLHSGSLGIIFRDIVGLAQDNPHHTFTVDKHSYYVYEHIFKHYNKEDKEDLIIASIFHDIGKPFCKEYPEGLRYATYYGHDNVGGQLALRALMCLGYSQDRALKIATIVGLHMRKSFVLDMQADKKLEKLVGEDMYIKLNYIRQADTQAK